MKLNNLEEMEEELNYKKLNYLP